ncbi:MAG: CDP-diacylglycerol--serine O-phosphatidyltransferase [Leptonema sp. (in: bacteria)]
MNFKFIKTKLRWVPNLFTLGNLLLGFYSMILSLRSEFNPDILKISGILIILSVSLDGLDGFMARILDAKSELGAQLDSLADLITFGIAPATLFFMMFLADFKISFFNLSIPIGMILASFFPVSVAYRLARFNVSHSEDSFDGLPSPIGGLVIALLPLIIYELSFEVHTFVFIILYLLISYLMVSTIRYSKIQVSLFRRFSVFRGMIFIIFFFVLIIFLYIKFGLNIAAIALLFLIFLYIISGIISLLIYLIQIYKW